MGCIMKKIYIFTIIATVSFTGNFYAMHEELDNIIERRPINWDNIFKVLHPKETGIKAVNTYKSPDDKTLLFLAVVDKNYSAAEKLLKEYHANPNAPSIAYKVTPLMIACYYRDRDMMKLLFAYRANSALTDRAGKTCLDYIKTKYKREKR